MMNPLAGAKLAEQKDRQEHIKNVRNFGIKEEYTRNAFFMINIVIGSHKRFERVEPVIEYSIRKHTKSDVNIIIARPEYYGLPDTGCTGFSNIRFYVPDILNHKGFGIYLDVDMLLLSDIAEHES